MTTRSASKGQNFPAKVEAAITSKEEPAPDMAPAEAALSGFRDVRFTQILDESKDTTTYVQHTFLGCVCVGYFCRRWDPIGGDRIMQRSTTATWSGYGFLGRTTVHCTSASQRTWGLSSRV